MLTVVLECLHFLCLEVFIASYDQHNDKMNRKLSDNISSNRQLHNYILYQGISASRTLTEIYNSF